MTTASYLAAAALAVAGLTTACGGNDSTGPSTGGGGGGGGSTNTTTITIASSGVSPASVTVPLGSRVTFVNNDSQPHTMDSDPHPEHTTCPEINVGFIAAGASGTTQNLTTARTCTFHDHNQPSNNALKGTIRIQ